MILALFITASVFASTSHPPHRAHPPHMDLEITSAEYSAILKQTPRAFATRPDQLDEILVFGKRNIDWISQINALRPEDQKIQLSNPASQAAGIPMDRPNHSSPTLIEAKLAQLRSEIPAELDRIWFQGASLPNNPPLGDAEFTAYARRLDGIYQGASRWILQEPYMDYYKWAKQRDIRGVYYLKRIPAIEEELGTWATLSEEKRKQYTEWLIGMCMNQPPSNTTCASLLDSAIQANTVRAFYTDRLWDSSRAFGSFFTLGGMRAEAIWNGTDPNVFTLPFAMPQTEEIAAWFKHNVEDEWRLGDLKLLIQFKPVEAATLLAKLVFVPGATPNVNRLGGDTITMDANRPLEEYSTRWTIRHEFGHVLGIPDCYVEFFDESKQVMTSYQIDISNLMCSRAGRLKPIHFETLRPFYYMP